MIMFEQECISKTSVELNLRRKFKNEVVGISDISGIQQRTETPEWRHHIADTGKPYIVTNIHLRDGRTLCSDFTVAELLEAVPEIADIKKLKITTDVNGGTHVANFSVPDFLKRAA